MWETPRHGHQYVSYHQPAVGTFCHRHCVSNACQIISEIVPDRGHDVVQDAINHNHCNPPRQGQWCGPRQ